MPESSKKLEVSDNFFHAESAEIIVRHIIEVSFDLLRKIWSNPGGDGVVQASAFQFSLRDKPLLILQVARGRMV